MYGGPGYALLLSLEFRTRSLWGEGGKGDLSRSIILVSTTTIGADWGLFVGEREDRVGLEAEWSFAQGDESAQGEREFSQSKLLRIPFYLYSMISQLRSPSA
jgi:hypothetical protein